MMKLFALLLFFSQLTWADQYLIDEMEALKASLEKQDPGRQELTLRLADLYFDVSIQEGEESQAGEKLAQRSKALELYQDVLEGRDGIAKVDSKREILVKYQVARVYRKLGKMSESKDYFYEVYTSNLSDKNLKRESAYSLAEYYEEEVNFEAADSYYQAAIDLCESKESCNLAHYKRAWLLYKELKIDQAIAELKLALFDRKNQVREKIINDLMLFISNRTTDGSEEVAYIQELIDRTGKKDLMRMLVESFYGAGNRVAGATALVYLNSQKPDIFYEMRLLEEYYGFRDWDEIEKYLSALEQRKLAQLPKKKEEAKEFKEMFKRVIVQFGSEAEEDPKQYSSYLRRAIDQYLVFYPDDDMRTKLQQGWLKAQSDKKAKVDRLGQWIVQDTALGKQKNHLRKLRQTRLSLAQELELKDIVLEESLELAQLLKGSQEAREFLYIAGLHYYKANQYDFALAKFKPLANISSLEAVDKWAVLAQNLTLDIYNQQKNFKALSDQADGWLTQDPNQADKNLKSELETMQEIKTQSQFEYFASLGESPKALASFYDYCFKGIYEQKSCENAKVLAIKLKDQAKLVALLEKNKVEKSLMVEYERMGRFSDAAKLQEKYNLNAKSELPEFFAIAALYELDQDFTNRDRILGKALKTFKKPLAPKMETALYVTLDEAGLIDKKSILYPWSVERKIELANRFSDNKKSIQFVAKRSDFSGPLWSRLKLDQVEANFKQVARYRFYGQNSEARFKRRVRILTKFAEDTKALLTPADTETRIYLLDMLKRAYLNLGTEIMSTPMPEGLTEEILMQVQANLTQLATPYLTVADDYTRLQNEEIKNLDTSMQAIMNERLEQEIDQYSQFIEKEEYKEVLTGAYDYQEYSALKIELQKTPYNLEILEKMRSFYTQNKNQRLAGYFSGRINQLKESQ